MNRDQRFLVAIRIMWVVVLMLVLALSCLECFFWEKVKHTANTLEKQKQVIEKLEKDLQKDLDNFPEREFEGPEEDKRSFLEKFIWGFDEEDQ